MSSVVSTREKLAFHALVNYHMKQYQEVIRTYQIMIQKGFNLTGRDRQMVIKVTRQIKNIKKDAVALMKKYEKQYNECTPPNEKMLKTVACYYKYFEKDFVLYCLEALYFMNEHILPHCNRSDELFRTYHLKGELCVELAQHLQKDKKTFVTYAEMAYAITAAMARGIDLPDRVRSVLMYDIAKFYVLFHPSSCLNAFKE